jgi:hypothetical protein
MDDVIDGLTQVGFSKEEIIDTNNHILSGRATNMISTDGLIGLVYLLGGYKIIDVSNVKDNYTGEGHNTTVRIILDASLAHILK